MKNTANDEQKVSESKKTNSIPSMILLITLTSASAYFILLYKQSQSIQSPDIKQNVVTLTPFPLLQEDGSIQCNADPVALSERLLPVQSALVEQKQDLLSNNNKVFIMLNGENFGHYFTWNRATHSHCLARLAFVAAKHLGASGLDLGLPLMLYSPFGVPITTIKDIETAGRILHVLLDQEVWVWPGISVGHSWMVNDIEMTTLSLKPKVIHVKGFLSKEECEEVINAGKDILQPSPSISGDDSQFPNYRTSSTAFIFQAQISAIIASRAQKIVRLPFEEYVESIQLVKYEKGQWFKEHTDYFDHFNLTAKLLQKRAASPHTDFQAWVSWAQHHIAKYGANVPQDISVSGKLYPSENHEFQRHLGELITLSEENPIWKEVGKEWYTWMQKNSAIPSVQNLITTFLASFPHLFHEIRKCWEAHAGPRFILPAKIKYIEPNRHATLFLYLNDVEEGGETVFPYSKEKNKEAIKRNGMEECSRGLAVAPILGDGALFYSKTPQGVNDEYSYHGGCPPVKGVKYGSNVFMWNVDAKYGVKIWGF